MPQSPEYRILRNRYYALKKHFLPRRFNPTGDYNEKIIDSARAFRLLLHAEIEDYVETRAKVIATASSKAWEADKIPSRVLVALLSYTEYEPGKKPDVVSERINVVLGKFKTKVGGNNGIKRANILGMLQPIGIFEVDLDEEWLADVDALGSERGVAAHRSAGRSISYADPLDESNRGERIIRGLKRIDELLSKVSKPIQKFIASESATDATARPEGHGESASPIVP